ncbi:uncharacterized protein [Anabrus simplex]
MPEKDYHCINFNVNEVSEKLDQSNQEDIMTDSSGNSSPDVEDRENDNRTHSSQSNDNPILVQSSPLATNQEAEVDKPISPSGRPYSAPVVNNRNSFKEKRDRPHLELELNCKNSANLYMSVGVQVSPSPQYRLRFLPICGCSQDESEWEFCHFRFFLRLIGRWAFSQCGLGILLFLWALLGAAAFQQTEGPREDEQTTELRLMQKELIDNLAKDLKKVNSSSLNNTESLHRGRISEYVVQHEQLLLQAVSSGYGEGGGGGKVWNYAGCILFAVSLLTTLGFGAPVPRTTLGRISAVIFAAIGIPLHLLLVLNIGMLVAVKLQCLATNLQLGSSFCSAFGQCCCHYNGKKPHCSQQDIHPTEGNSVRQVEVSNESQVRETNIHFHPPFTPPCWLKCFPAISIAVYYTFGVLLFGAGRQRPFSACLLFPLDFTAAGGVGLTSSTIRTIYAIYLEGAVTLAAISVAVLQVSASKGLVNLGLKLGLLTNS